MATKDFGHCGGHPGRGTVALAYDELPEGSTLRREFDGRGGVTITAPAGEPSASVRRDAGRASLGPAVVALALCLALIGSLLLHQIGNNRVDPQLRTLSLVVLGVLATGVFLFVWLTRHAALSHALADARRRASVLHANGERLLVEVATPSGAQSLDVPTARILSVQVASAPLDPARSAAVPCLKLSLRDGTSHLLLAGHHSAELRWVAAAVSSATGVPVVVAEPKWDELRRGLKLLTG